MVCNHFHGGHVFHLRDSQKRHSQIRGGWDLNKKLGFWSFIVLIIGAVFLEISHQRAITIERRINEERTRRAVAQVLDSIRIEHNIIIKDCDTLKQLLRNFVWVIGLFGLKTMGAM